MITIRMAILSFAIAAKAVAQLSGGLLFPGPGSRSGIAQVSTPTDAPGAGTYGSSQTVTLSCATSGCVICYSVDGSTPTATTPGTCDGLTYSTGLTVSSTTTVKALGTKSGVANSGVLSSVYTFVADTAFITGVTPGTDRSNYDGCLGFQVGLPAGPGITVTQLGRYTHSGNSQTHTLHIRQGTTVLGSCTVNASGAPAGQFLYCTLASPVTLAAMGSYEIMSSEVNGGDVFYDSDTAVTSTAAATVTTATFSTGATTGTCAGTFGTYRGSGFAFVPVTFKYH